MTTYHRKPKPTKSELKLSRRLKKEKIKHLSNSRLLGFYPDILIPEKKLIIEVDGAVHNLPRVRKRDKIRTRILTKAGYKLIRFTNHQVNYRMDWVMKCVHSFLKLGS